MACSRSMVIISWLGAACCMECRIVGANRLVKYLCLMSHVWYCEEMSRRVLNPSQLKMFMTPREIAATIPQNETHMKGPEDLKHDYVAQSKMIRANRNGLAASIASEGVKKPLDIMHETDATWGDHNEYLVNGHHRFSVSLDIAPDRLVPVQHHDNFNTIDWTSGDSDPRGTQAYGNPERMWKDTPS